MSPGMVYFLFIMFFVYLRLATIWCAAVKFCTFIEVAHASSFKSVLSCIKATVRAGMFFECLLWRDIDQLAIASANFHALKILHTSRNLRSLMFLKNNPHVVRVDMLPVCIVIVVVKKVI